MYNGYTPTTPHERLQAQRQIKRAELIEAIGDYQEYIRWANELSVTTHLDPAEFIEAANVKLEEIEKEAGEIIGIALRTRMLDRIDFICELNPPLSVTEDGPETVKTNGVY